MKSEASRRIAQEAGYAESHVAGIAEHDENEGDHACDDSGQCKHLSICGDLHINRFYHCPHVKTMENVIDFNP